MSELFLFTFVATVLLFPVPANSIARDGRNILNRPASEPSGKEVQSPLVILLWKKKKIH